MGSDGTSVDLGALTTFAHTLGTSADGQLADIKGFGQTMQQAGAQCVSAPNFEEGRAFHAYHMTVLNSTAKFMNELMEGVATLGAGAETAAINYASAEDLNAFNLSQIQADIKAGKGFSAMDVIFGKGQTANVSGDDLNAAFNPKDGEGMPWSSPNGGDNKANSDLPDGKTDPTKADNWKTEFDKRAANPSDPSVNNSDANNQYKGDVTVGTGPDAYTTPKDATGDHDLYPGKPDAPVQPK